MNLSEHPDMTYSQDNSGSGNPYMPQSTQSPQPSGNRSSQPSGMQSTQYYASSALTSAPRVQSVPVLRKQSDYWRFSRFHKLFAVISVLLAYLMKSCVLTTGGTGPYSLMFFEVTLAAVLVYLIKTGVRLKAPTVIWYALLAIYPVSFVIIDNPLMKVFGAFLLLIMILLFVYTASADIKCFKESFLYDFVQAVFAAPFKYFPALPVALFKPAHDSKGKRILRYVLIGLCVALPLTAVLLAILVSSDEAFRSFIGDRLMDDIVEILKDVLLCIPFAFLIFSVVMFSYRDRGRIKARKSSALTLKARGNSVIFVTIYIPVIILYLIFFFSQFAYFTDAFKNILPAKFTYSEYAVQGFFEMCLVVAINIVLVVLTLAICRKNEQGRVPAVLRIEMVVFSLFSLIFAAIAVAKTVMYTNAYGLTHRRVYALFAIAALVALVVIALLKALVPKLGFFKVTVCTLAVILFAMSFTNVDAVIAKYNVKWYKEGKISWMGEKALYNLDKSSVPYLAELLDDDAVAKNEIESGYRWYSENYYYYNDYLDDKDEYDECYGDGTETVGEQVRGYFGYLRSYDLYEDGFNLAAYRAEQIFKENTIVQVPIDPIKLIN